MSSAISYDRLHAGGFGRLFLWPLLRPIGLKIKKGTQQCIITQQAQGTRVIGVLPGYVDTAMAERIDAPKIQPIEVVRATLDALQTDQDEVYPGEAATQIAALLLQNPKAVERQFAQSVAA
jgi:hypothetical protein